MPCAGRARGGTGAMRGQSAHLMITGAAHLQASGNCLLEGYQASVRAEQTAMEPASALAPDDMDWGGFVIGKGRPLLRRQLYSGNPGSRLAPTNCGSGPSCWHNHAHSSER